jgi:collagenase-like PrtC family protease
MKVCAGIVKKNELSVLARAGADEFFCGFLPREWQELFGPEISANRREALSPNITTYRQLKDVMSEAHRLKKRVYVNFNAHYYTREAYSLLKKMILRCLEYGADGIIVADVGLLQRIKEWGLEVNVILSGEYGVRNTYDIRIVSENFKVSRVILPRHMSLEDIELLVRAFPQYEFEAFAVLVRCPFDGANCFPIHAFPHLDSVQKFCDDFYGSPKSFNVKDNRFLRYFEKANYALHEYSNRAAACNLVRGESRAGKPGAFTCGLCAIPALKKYGVKSMKVPSRGENLSESRAAVSLVKKIIDNDYDEGEIRRLYSEAISNHFKEMCDSRYMCYYP